MTAVIEDLVRAIPDFPIPGILFRDITPVLASPNGFRSMVDLFIERYRTEQIDAVVGIEARGYMMGAPLAYALKAGFIPVRKPGKLPFDKLSESYSLEYGTNTLEIHRDAIKPGQRVLIVDDLLATGGTAAATGRLVRALQGHLVGYGFLIEIAALEGRAQLRDAAVSSFLTY